MVDWNSPLVLFRSARAAVLANHIFVGAYLWEFIRTLGYDWDVVRGRRRFSPALVLYLFVRYMVLLASILTLRVMTVFEENDADCNTLIYVLNFAGYSSAAALTGLMYLRVCALSKRNLFVVYGAGLAWLGCWGMVVWATYQSKTNYVPELFICNSADMKAHRLNVSYQFAIDVVLTLVMLFYLLTMEHRGRTWQFLLSQGLVYFVSITVAYGTAAVVVAINPNDAVSRITETLALLIAALCSTGMQRDLEDFATNPDRGMPAGSPYIPGVTSSFGNRPETFTINQTTSVWDITPGGIAMQAAHIDDEKRVFRYSNFPENGPRRI